MNTRFGGHVQRRHTIANKQRLSEAKRKPVKVTLASVERRCQKCGRTTKGEEVLVGDQTWCHPCADDDDGRG